MNFGNHEKTIMLRKKDLEKNNWVMWLDGLGGYSIGVIMGNPQEILLLLDVLCHYVKCLNSHEHTKTDFLCLFN